MEMLPAELLKQKRIRRWPPAGLSAIVMGLATLCIVLTFLFELRSGAIILADILAWGLSLTVLSLLVAAYLISWHRARALEAVNATLLREIEVRRQAETAQR
ncbi:MAG TPA: hypothetical protein P5329_06575, partial [Candidatus Competibacteraceae bacterium]|nr:hypothetical protein [Candidatus Competibacteraceae bacterium]